MCRKLWDSLRHNTGWDYFSSVVFWPPEYVTPSWSKSLLDIVDLQMTSNMKLRLNAAASRNPSRSETITWTVATPTGQYGVRTIPWTGSLKWSLWLCCYVRLLPSMSGVQTPSNFTFTFITALLHAVVRWLWFPRQSDPFSWRTSLTRFHPHVTSMALNLEQLKSLVKSDNTVTSVHSSSAVHPG